jgi:hypothetical protein
MATLFGLHPFLLKLYADGGYQGPQFQGGLRRIMRQVDVEIVKRSDAAKGFTVLPKRSIVLPRTILPDSASSGQPWSLVSGWLGPAGPQTPLPS